MAKPIKHGDKWRIRWLDERGKRQSAVFDDYRRAQVKLSQRLVEVDEIKRGLRSGSPPEKTFADLCEYWLECGFRRMPIARFGTSRSPVSGHRDHPFRDPDR